MYSSAGEFDGGQDSAVGVDTVHVVAACVITAVTAEAARDASAVRYVSHLRLYLTKCTSGSAPQRDVPRTEVLEGGLR